MSRPKLEVADIFRDHGAAWRSANAGHVSLDQLKVMTAIERCRTAALGGHVERCEKCSHTIIAYNSCRNRHCPKCQGAAARKWLAEREAISNRRLIACDEKSVTFKWKDYRLEGPERYQVMTLATHEFIRRFLMHVLPAGFHRIRYYGLLASSQRAENVARARQLLAPPIIPLDAIKAISPNAADSPNAAEPQTTNLCPCCGGRMIIIERFEPGATPHYRASPPPPAIRIDTS
jgi:hypothetical protein